MKRIAALSLTIPFLFAFGAKHSSVTTSVKNAGNELTFQFQIKPDNGMQLTHQAPWSVTISDTEGLDLPMKDGKFISKDYDKSLPGFTVKTKASGVKSGNIKFKMKAFVCTEDKKRCYPQTHKGSLNWKI